MGHITNLTILILTNITRSRIKLEIEQEQYRSVKDNKTKNAQNYIRESNVKVNAPVFYIFSKCVC